jgi:hypothetical protein
MQAAVVYSIPLCKIRMTCDARTASHGMPLPATDSPSFHVYVGMPNQVGGDSLLESGECYAQPHTGANEGRSAVPHCLQQQCIVPDAQRNVLFRFICSQSQLQLILYRFTVSHDLQTPAFYLFMTCVPADAMVPGLVACWSFVADGWSHHALR